MIAPLAPAIPKINMEQLRSSKHTRKTFSHGAHQSKASGSAKVSKRYGSFILPKTFKFICIPYNALERTPSVPRQTSRLYTILEDNNMVKDIVFEQGDHEYCTNRVIQELQHLSLSSFQFYRAQGSNLELSPIIRFTSARFDLNNLSEYVQYLTRFLISTVLPVVILDPKRSILVRLHLNLMQSSPMKAAMMKPLTLIKMSTCLMFHLLRSFFLQRIRVLDMLLLHRKLLNRNLCH